MPNIFRVGDRVRRIGIPDYINATMSNGTVWTVSEIVDNFFIRVEDDPFPQGTRSIEYFELVEPPVVVERVYVCYLILYQVPGINILSARRSTEEAANREVDRIIRDGGTVHAKKKITVRY